MIDEEIDDAGFQSTRPVWGATLPITMPRTMSRISIHAPRVGRDHHNVLHRPCAPNFNPRAPCGARRAVLVGQFGVQHISIHAPRVGRDCVVRHSVFLIRRFQSTRPVWGATVR